MNPQNYPSLPNTSLVYESIRDSGFGVLKMPPTNIDKVTAIKWVESTIDQIEEYSKRGFKVLILGASNLPGGGIWLDLLKERLRERGLALPRIKLLGPSQLKRSNLRTIISSFLSGE